MRCLDVCAVGVCSSISTNLITLVSSHFTLIFTSAFLISSCLCLIWRPTDIEDFACRISIITQLKLFQLCRLDLEFVMRRVCICSCFLLFLYLSIWCVLADFFKQFGNISVEASDKVPLIIPIFCPKLIDMDLKIMCSDFNVGLMSLTPVTPWCQKIRFSLKWLKTRITYQF